MKDAKVVIGSNFGDEGKGLFTDYLSNKFKESGIVIRFNGGSQAAHSVQLENGKRHVFGHFGAGTFNNVPTFLSRYFIVNPYVFLDEYELLKNYNPIVFVDKECIVTTPFDVLINHIIEEKRGDKKHGSCGLGINETIERSLNNNRYLIEVSDLLKNPKELKDKLRLIKEEYFFNRLRILGIENIDDKYKERLYNENIIENFILDCQEFIKKIIIPSDLNFVKNKNIIFEGAQGLLLDQNHKWFPHVTRSNTGLKNVIELCNDFEISKLDIYYITRTYMTRHGAGPFPTEQPEKIYSKIIDKTNIPNNFQGSLRFGYLDIPLMNDTINFDLIYANKFIIRKNIVITCMDQVDEDIPFKDLYDILKLRKELFPNFLKVTLGFDRFICSYGPTRNDILNRF